MVERSHISQLHSPLSLITEGDQLENKQITEWRRCQKKRCSEQSQSHRTGDTQPHDSPPSLNDLLVRQLLAQIPNKMSHPIEGVICERQCNSKLHSKFGCKRERPERSCYRGRFEMPAKQRRDEISRREDIKSAGENGASDTVQSAAIPCYLWSIDGEMW